MFDSPGFVLFVIAVLLVLGWFVWGTQTNVRRGNRALKWLQTGLPRVGEKTTLRWLGSSVVDLHLTQAKAPFRTLETLLVLEPRDIPVFWALGHLDGRRDLIILRAQLVRAPGFDLEARRGTTWKAASARRDSSGSWTALPDEVNGLRAEYRGNVQPDAVTAVLGRAQWEGLPLARLSLSRALPNLEVHLRWPDLERASAAHLFNGLRDLAQAAIDT